MKRKVYVAGILLAALFVQGCSENSDGKDVAESSSSSKTKKVLNSFLSSSSSVLSSSADAVSKDDTVDSSTSSQNGNAAAGALFHSLELSITVSELSENNETSIMLKGIYSNGKKKPLSENITWQISDANILEVKGMKLVSKVEGTATVRAEVNGKLSPARKITVYRVINGHRLPPEPDPKINNSTLLGIDSNNNGVRDDVERWIYMTYNHPVEHGLFMQAARAYQKVIVDPSRAHETRRYLTCAVHCESYWSMSDEEMQKRDLKFTFGEYRLLEDEIKVIQFNTLERYMAYKRYNATLSGGIYSDNLKPDEWINCCDFDLNETLGPEE